MRYEEAHMSRGQLKSTWLENFRIWGFCIFWMYGTSGLCCQNFGTICQQEHSQFWPWKHARHFKCSSNCFKVEGLSMLLFPSFSWLEMTESWFDRRVDASRVLWILGGVSKKMTGLSAFQSGSRVNKIAIHFCSFCVLLAKGSVINRGVKLKTTSCQSTHWACYFGRSHAVLSCASKSRVGVSRKGQSSLAAGVWLCWSDVVLRSNFVQRRLSSLVTNLLPSHNPDKGRSGEASWPCLTNLGCGVQASSCLLTSWEFLERKEAILPAWNLQVAFW